MRRLHAPQALWPGLHPYVSPTYTKSIIQPVSATHSVCLRVGQLTHSATLLPSPESQAAVTQLGLDTSVRLSLYNGNFCVFIVRCGTMVKVLITNWVVLSLIMGFCLTSGIPILSSKYGVIQQTNGKDNRNQTQK